MPEINFFWDPLSDNILQERDETGAVTAEYTAEPGHYGNIISQRRQGEYRQFHYDGQGSTLAVTDESEHVTDTFAYTAFGEVAERTGTTEVPFQYIGQKGYYTDGQIGQIMVRRRPYEPVSVRWLAVDPLGLRLTDTNLFCYAHNRATLLTDLSGLRAWIAPGNDIPFPDIDIPFPDIFPPSPPSSPHSLPVDLCDLIPCKALPWKPWMCNYTDDFGVTTECKCADSYDGRNADEHSCNALLNQARRIAEGAVRANVVLGRFYCSDKCGGTDYGLTCWRLIKRGPNAGKIELGICIPYGKANVCNLQALIEHEMTHVQDLLELWDGEGVNAEIGIAVLERHAYQQQCAMLASQECLTGGARRQRIGECVSELISLSTSPQGRRQIGRGCDGFAW